jgi:hypothetical protein
MTAPAAPSPASAFTASASARGVWALLFAVAAIALVVLVEQGRPPATAPAATTPGPAATAAPRTLRLEATFAVATWTVQAGNAAVAATSSDDQHWTGTVTTPGELLVQADPADPADARPHALRIVLDGATRTAWGAGTITELLPAPAPAPAP